MLFELTIFALVLSVCLAGASMMAALLMFNYMMSEKFMKKYAKKTKDLMITLYDEDIL